MDDKRVLLTHFLAALAYRVQKALRGSSDEFGEFEPGNQIRSPKDLVRHMTSVLGYSRTFFIGGRYWPDPLPTLAEEVARFHEMLSQLKRHLEDGDELAAGITPERLLQGPFADAMTHAGQLAMLRRMFGDPVPPENFVDADISAENVTSEQPEPARPDDVWPEAPIDH